MHHLDFEEICPLTSAILKETFDVVDAKKSLYPQEHELSLGTKAGTTNNIEKVTLRNLHKSDPTFDITIPAVFHGANVTKHIESEVTTYNKVVQRRREEDRIKDPQVKKAYQSVAGIVNSNEGRSILLGLKLNNPKLDFLEKAELGKEILTALHCDSENMSGLDVKNILTHCEFTEIHIRKPEALERELLSIVEEVRHTRNRVGKIILQGNDVCTGDLEMDVFIVRLLERLFDYCDKTRY